MKALCTIPLRPAANPKQLQELAEILERWSDEQLDTGACLCRVDPRCLADLNAGELPRPNYLRHTSFIRELGKAADILGGDPIELEPYQHEQLKNELGEGMSTRNVEVYIEYDPEPGYDDAVEMLGAVLPKDLAEDPIVCPVPDEDEGDESDQ